MERIKSSLSLSIVIPTYNEAKNLPLLIADLNLWPYPLEIFICDANSDDLTARVAALAGAEVVNHPEPNRGAQLHKGYAHTTGDWILFLHADCRLTNNWPVVIERVIRNELSQNIAWYFDLKIDSNRFDLTLMELMVSIRSKYLQRPYGDQGLLIHRSLYTILGGYNPYYIMEDLDFIERVSDKANLKRLGLPIYSNSRRWKKVNVLVKAYENAKLRRHWRMGESSKSLAKKYYKARK